MLNVQNVSHGYGERQILDNASFRMKKGEHIGLVGANGEGKTTFLNIITGVIPADEGTVTWAKRATVGYLDQHAVLKEGMTIRDVLRTAFNKMYQLETDMLDMYNRMADCTDEEMAQLMDDVGEIQDILDHSGFYTIDSRIEEFANGLGLGEIGLDRDVSRLSGGQRTKVLLTKLLLENPTILILDEPTNYLDENHIRWLTTFLQNYENAFMLVSHDVPFLNAVTNVIYHVENAVLTRYKGNYDEFMAMYELKKRQLEQAYEKQQKEIEKLEDFISRNKARAATATLARSRQKRLDKMDVIELAKEKPKANFEFQYSRAPGKVVVRGENLVLGYDSALTKPVNFEVERGQKIAIKGVNGLGKSTLLKTMLGIIPPFSGKVELDYYAEPAYFEQEHIGSSKTALYEIWDMYPSMTNPAVRGVLAKCGLTSRHIETQCKVLSGGENAKVRLCAIMLKPMNLLVLDEPTNHLDVEAKASLKEAIRNFKGTVILVSHEPEFYEDIVTDVWNLENWTTKIV
ncbi:MAG: ABC-F family ATP-binding cassette domain-containing protein [Oscillospiraceae bacterium]|nr:ABC-F family ATP-binding cassette domain-containing protein [Oscillospiraceae bacterium]